MYVFFIRKAFQRNFSIAHKPFRGRKRFKQIYERYNADCCDPGLLRNVLVRSIVQRLQYFSNVTFTCPFSPVSENIFSAVC